MESHSRITIKSGGVDRTLIIPSSVCLLSMVYTFVEYDPNYDNSDFLNRNIEVNPQKISGYYKEFDDPIIPKNISRIYMQYEINLNRTSF